MGFTDKPDDDIIEPDYIAIDCGDYDVTCGVSCYYSGGDAYTSVYPGYTAYTSVYVGATLYAKNLSSERIVEYGSDKFLLLCKN